MKNIENYFNELGYETIEEALIEHVYESQYVMKLAEAYEDFSTYYCKKTVYLAFSGIGRLTLGLTAKDEKIYKLSYRKGLGKYQEDDYSNYTLEVITKEQYINDRNNFWKPV